MVAVGCTGRGCPGSWVIGAAVAEGVAGAQCAGHVGMRVQEQLRMVWLVAVVAVMKG